MGNLGKYIFVFFCISSLYGQKTESLVNVLEEGFEKRTFDKQFVYAEMEKVTDIDFVLRNDSLFTPTENPFVNTGLFNKINWIYLDVHNTSKDSTFIFELNQTYIDSLQVYLVKNQKIVKRYPRKGLHFNETETTSFLSNKYAYLYPIEIPKDSTISLYIRAIVNDGGFMTMNKLWTEKAYEVREKDIKIRTSYLLAFSGFIGLILLLSLTMFFFSRNTMYFYYFGFVLIAFANLLCLRHFVNPVIIEKHFLFGNYFLEMFSLLQVFLMVMYTNKFFSLETTYPRIYKAFSIFAYIILGFFVLGLFLRDIVFFKIFFFAISKILLLVVVFLMYGIAFYLIKRKERMAYYYIIAYFPLFLFVGHYLFTALKLTRSYNPLQLEFVVFFEVLVLAIAMAHKYFLLIEENSDYQNVLINQKQKNLEGVLAAQEKERSRIAKDLHDGVVQQIGSVLLRFRNLLSKSNLLEEKESQEVLLSLENSNSELRTISHQMMPRSLKELGIISAVDDLLNQSFPYANIQFQFEHFNLEKRIANTIELVLYRVFQELVANIIKHSQASSVNIQLFGSQNSIILLVEDDGIGMKNDIDSKGIGLMNMKSRLETVNGTIHFESTSEKGTLATVKISL